MKRIQVAIIGFGRLGRACANAIRSDDHFELAGIVRRPESIKAEPLSLPYASIPAVSHVSELKNVDAALICVPLANVRDTVHDLLQHGIAIVECAKFQGDALLQHKQAIAHMASRFETVAIIGAGWNPGALSLFRNLFALLTPKGHTETSYRPGTTLHHTTVARAIPGVKDALCTEVRSTSDKPQRYLYIELEKGARFRDVELAILSDPLFLDEETLIFPVDDIATLEDEGHGILMERQGVAANAAHQHLLLEARFSEVALCAQCMVAGARAVPSRKAGGYTFFDLPPGTLWGQLRAHAEREWL